MDKVSCEDLIYKKGIFAKNFPIKLNHKETLTKTKKITDEFNKTKISQKEFEDIVELSDKFDFHFMS